MTNINIMIATPAYDDKVNIPYCLSYANTILQLTKHNIQVTPVIVSSGSLLVAERNRLIEAFWNSPCTHILCIDSDLGWPAEAVLAMIEQKKDFIAGVYPARSDKEDTFTFRAALNQDGAIIQDKHLLKMEYIPAGFMLLSRNCIEKMRDHFPELHYKPKANIEDNPPEGYCLFNTEVWEGEFWGEDYVFCRRAREAGIDIWVDPLIQFSHGNKLGMLLTCLRNSKGEKVV